MYLTANKPCACHHLDPAMTQVFLMLIQCFTLQKYAYIITAPLVNGTSTKTSYLREHDTRRLFEHAETVVRPSTSGIQQKIIIILYHLSF